jgi:hypothetical protein
MQAFLARRWAPTAVLACAVLISAGGGAYAIAASSGKTVTLCVHKKGGGVYKGKCKKHDSKLKLGQVGPKGPTGATGSTGATGATGPAGPGATTFTFSGTASSTPVMQTLGTVDGATIAAECGESSGVPELVVFIKTSDGSWSINYDLVEYDSSGGSSSYVNTLNYPAGTFNSFQAVDELTPSTATATVEHQFDFIQIGPVKGGMTWHERANGSAGTCALTVQGYGSA